MVSNGRLGRGSGSFFVDLISGDFWMALSPGWREHFERLLNVFPSQPFCAHPSLLSLLMTDLIVTLIYSLPTAWNYGKLNN